MARCTTSGMCFAIVFCFCLQPPLSAQKPETDRTTIIIRLPKEARLRFDGKLTSQSGSERTFSTPDLDIGKLYTYTVDVAWMAEGKERKAQKVIQFPAGDTVVVNFLEEDQPKNPATKSRTFQFIYAATIKGLNGPAKVWVPIAPANDEQDAKLLENAVIGAEPGRFQTGTESRYGNRIGFAEMSPGKDGTVSLKLVYQITRREVVGKTSAAKDDTKRIKRFLEPDALVPVTGKPLDLLKGKSVPEDRMKQAKLFYDVVNGHMKYSKEGLGWGRGDSVWACDSKFGNCSDFHSLFISLARSKRIPAKFEIGFPLPAKRGEGKVGGYHCWALFNPDNMGWVPVDISEGNKDPKMAEYYFGNLTENRVLFSCGRDLDLQPQQSGKALNFFVYPYVEVEGKTHPQEKIESQFSYRDEQ